MRRKLIFTGILFIIFAISLTWLSNRQKLNIVFIVIDSLRPDHLGCYGYLRPTSPTIDQLSKESILFTQAISPSTVTLLSVPSILTSTLPTTHMVYDWEATLNPSLKTVAQILKEKGYRTAFFSNHGIVGKIKGLEKGFDVFLDEGELSSDKLTQRAIRWIEKKGKNPFFVYLHYMSVHVPYRPPPPYDQIFLKDALYKEEQEVPISEDERGKGKIPNFLAQKGITNPSYYVALYDGGIRYTDAQIARLLGWLKEKGFYKRTLILITADHGEFLGEHNLYFCHGEKPYDTVLRVPLIMRFPNLPPQKIERQVSTLDIVPTILEVLGINSPSMEGVSLLPLLQGKKNFLHPYIFSLSGNIPEKTGYSSVREEGWKLIHIKRPEGEDYQLFDLTQDPQEEKDVKNLRKDKYRELKSILQNWEREVWRKFLSSPRVKEEEILKRLRGLGYLH